MRADSTTTKETKEEEEEEEEEEETAEAEEKVDIKSSSPHLTGREKSGLKKNTSKCWMFHPAILKLTDVVKISCHCLVKFSCQTYSSTLGGKV